MSISGKPIGGQRAVVLAICLALITVFGSFVVAGASARSKSKAPAISSLSPGVGSTAGGTRVTITGSNFIGVTAVKFGKLKGSRLKVSSSRKLIVVAPKHSAGSVPVVITSKHGSSKAASWTYEKPDTLSIVAGVPGEAADPKAGPAAGSHLYTPYGVAVARNGDLYIADFNAYVVEKVTPSGRLSIVAGVPGQSGYPSTGRASKSKLRGPVGVAVAPNGDLYIADDFGSLIEKVTPVGKLTIVAGVLGEEGRPKAGKATQSELKSPVAVAIGPSGDLYIADQEANVIEKVTPSGKLSIAAGTGALGLPTAGRATKSDLSEPSGVAVSAHGDLYIADGQNNVIEKVTPSGKLSIVAGIKGHSGTPTQGRATKSQLNFPYGLAIAPNGDLYIGDYGNDVVEVVTPSGYLSKVAGIPGTSNVPTAGLATDSDLGHPSGVALDTNGDLYIADTGESLVEKVFAP
jgi:IPT/TIG domain-containing protein/NHL repeat-containing protein